MISDIIWDFDGTLVDTYPAIADAINRALHHFRRSASLEVISELSSISLGHCLTTLADRFTLPLAEFEAAFWPVYQQITPTDQPPFPDVMLVCSTVQEMQGRNFIVTHRRRTSLMALLEAHQMAPLFTAIVAGDDGFPRKPDPGAFLHLIHNYAIDQRTALVIGPRCAAGQRTGLRTCLFRSVFPNCTPHDYVTSYGEFLTLMQQWRYAATVSAQRHQEEQRHTPRALISCSTCAPHGI